MKAVNEASTFHLCRVIHAPWKGNITFYFFAALASPGLRRTSGLLGKRALYWRREKMA